MYAGDFFVRLRASICACVTVVPRDRAGLGPRLGVCRLRSVTESLLSLPAHPQFRAPSGQGGAGLRGAAAQLGAGVLPPYEPPAPRSAQPQRCWRQPPRRAAGFQPPQAGKRTSLPHAPPGPTALPSSHKWNRLWTKRLSVFPPALSPFRLYRRRILCIHWLPEPKENRSSPGLTFPICEMS